MPKSITCSYKVSYAKKMQRLGVLWRNTTRLLVFHELLFGPDKLRFVSMDEKPYRFNACGGDQVWATRGQKSVKCKELRAMLLSRWTGITAVFSRRHPAATLPNGKWEPKWAALFKAKDGSRCGLTSPSSRCQVLFAEHGSVTTETWLKYLRHILPRVDNPEHAIVPVTDWYGPHLAEEAIDFAMERTLSPTALIGGGTTGEGAVCDKTPHRVLASKYRQLEMCAHTNALSYRPDKVPRWTKQQVLDRGWQAWQELDHSCGEKLHRSHGYTTKVDGTDDPILDSSIVHFWHRLDMPDVRRTLAVKVQALVDQEVYTAWSDAKDLIEPHDPHRVAYEGEEDAPIVDGSSEDGDDSDDDVGTVDDDDDGDGGDEGHGGDGRKGRHGLSTPQTTASTQAVETVTMVAATAISAATTIAVVTPLVIVPTGAEAGLTLPPTASVDARFKMRTL